MARVVVTGYAVRLPTAGNQMAFVPYVLGLERLGHHVVYLEESGWPGSCYDPLTRTQGDDPAQGLARTRALLRSQGSPAPVWWVEPARGGTDGADWAQVVRTLREADLVLNVGGVNFLAELSYATCHALVDLDPLFTQLGIFGGDLDAYDLLFTYGTAIGTPGCLVPTGGRNWRPLLPPAVPEMWPQRPVVHGRLTTVANWSAYRSVTHDGQLYGPKDGQLLRLTDLPARCSLPLEVALSGAPPEVVNQLQAGGWRVVNGGDVTRDLPAYAGYLTGSAGELSAAKHGYVAARTGWFSDRSACYLSAGRPVLLQDTGFSAALPCGQGLLAWSTPDDAVSAVQELAGDGPRHQRAARALAQDVLSYRRVLPPLLELAGAPAGSRA